MPALARPPAKKKPLYSLRTGAHFETVELGAGRANIAAYSARAHSGKNYAVVDVAYSRRKNRLADDKYREMAEHFRERAIQLHEKGVTIYPGDSLRFLKKMSQEGWRTKSIIIDMPHPNMFANPLPLREKFGPFQHFIQTVFHFAPRVLFPNGKIYITTERPEFVDAMRAATQEEGLSFRTRRPLSEAAAMWKTETTQAMMKRGATIFLVEITYPLKKAFPAKAERKRWKGN